MARLTFPDQQQDLQNAADFGLASECDGDVKFLMAGVTFRARIAFKGAVL
jgi:hypothetical protein